MNDAAKLNYKILQKNLLGKPKDSNKSIDKTNNNINYSSKIIVNTSVLVPQSSPLMKIGSEKSKLFPTSRKHDCAFS